MDERGVRDAACEVFYEEFRKLQFKIEEVVSLSSYDKFDLAIYDQYGTELKRLVIGCRNHYTGGAFLPIVTG